jgi:hypothetical protein
LPSFLHDGASFGERGVELELDTFFVQLALLRNRTQRFAEYFYQSLRPTERRNAKDFLRNLINQARVLSDEMSVWATNLPDEFKYTAQTFDVAQLDEQESEQEENLFFSNIGHHYRTLWHASIMQRYQAALIAVNIIITKAISRCILAGSAVEPIILAQQQQALSNAQTLVDDLCASFPFSFGLVNGSHQTTSISPAMTEIAVEQLTASTAFLLVWPMTIASAAVGISESQKNWIKNKLVLLSRKTGNKVLGLAARVRTPEVHNEV